MPKLNDGLVDHALTTGSYGYSAVNLEDLGASEYTLVTIVCDISGSVIRFADELLNCIKEMMTSIDLVAVLAIGARAKQLNTITIPRTNYDLNLLTGTRGLETDHVAEGPIGPLIIHLEFVGTHRFTSYPPRL